MRQAVMLTGLSSPMFDEAIASVGAIQDMFRRDAADGTMEEWTPSVFQEHISIDVGNRYYTPRQHALQDRQIAFSASIDPDNILSEAMGDQYIHVEENQVEYYEARKEGGGTKWAIDSIDISPELQANKFNDRHYDVAPNAFRVGDIVEAQISFEVIRLKGKRQKMIVILRALTLLDKEALEVSNGDCQKIISLNNPTECDQSTDQSSSQRFATPNDFEKEDWLSWPKRRRGYAANSEDEGRWQGGISGYLPHSFHYIKKVV